MAASYPTKIQLAMLSGGKCAFEKCRVNIVAAGKKSKTVTIGEAAHIYGENNGAARYRSDMTEEQRDAIENLIYLCPSCHTKIDKQEADYEAPYLLDLKKKHESWVASQLDEKMSQVGFAELDIAAKALATGKHSLITDFAVIPPEEKIQKNGLTATSHSLIAMGLSRSSEVTRYLEKIAQVDEDFPVRLINGFKDKYDELKAGLSGDGLFYALLEFAYAGKNYPSQNAASLAILSHLFHICEVFEK